MNMTKTGLDNFQPEVLKMRILATCWVFANPVTYVVNHAADAVSQVTRIKVNGKSVPPCQQENTTDITTHTVQSFHLHTELAYQIELSL